jgi:hypothetical protein
MAQRGSRSKNLVNRVADASQPHVDDTTPSDRSLWWWLLFGPGKFIVWTEYMWPGRVSGALGSARRRNVPLMQLLYSLSFYLAVIVLVGWLLLSIR